MTNPLLRDARSQPLPAFDAIRPDHAAAALETVLADNRAGLAGLLARTEPPTWDTLVEPLEEMGDRLQRAWGPVSHLFGVTSTTEWRAAYNACLPKITEYGLEVSQSEPLFQAYEALSKAPEFADYVPARRKTITDALRDFRLSGIGLPEDQKARYKAISMRLSELQTKFEENLMDAIQAWSKTVLEESLLAGMTESARSAARAKAQAKNLDGWLLTLDFPSYDAVITYAEQRALREEIYIAFVTRASDRGPLAGQHDNSPLMTEILDLRREQAQLLGYRNFAELSLATKMAESPDEVESFLVNLAQRARPRATAELAELQAYALQRDGLSDLKPWDMPYYAEKMKQDKLGLAEEELRPYFPLPQVVDGMFALVQRLYGLRIEPAPGLTTWHADVTAYSITDTAGAPVGQFYLDPYARTDKRSGAWMDECVNRRRTADGIQQPVAYLVCNFTPPLPGQPALLTHDEALTLFHEFGHGLHHLLTRVDEAAVAGIHGVAWDAVELPSQFMENWCYDPATLRGFARHWQTGEPLPDDVIARLRASRSFLTGLGTLRQLEFGLFDLRLHRDEDGQRSRQILAQLQQVRDEVAVMPSPDYNRMPCSFGHVFAGGYAAGYYSYKWAEVLSADAYAAFEESDFAAETGRRFRETILAQGGSKDAMDLFVEFRGRKPQIDALLRHTGLIEEAA